MIKAASFFTREAAFLLCVWGWGKIPLATPRKNRY